MIQDVRYAWRLLAKWPGFSVIVVLMLALGIRANSAVFSIVEGALLRPLPLKDPNRLVDVLDASVRESGLSKLFDSYADFEEYRRHARSFDQIAMATWAGGGSILTGRGPAKGVVSIPVSENFLSMLGVAPALGRVFGRDDLIRGCSVVLGDAFWRGTFGGDSRIVGETITLDRRACRVLGVMPATFGFYRRQSQLWMLLDADCPRPLDTLPVIVFARLKRGVTAAQARTELAALHAAIHRDDKESDFTPVVDKLQDEFTFLAGRNLRTTLWVLLGAVVFVLLIACSNVANLLLDRSFVREREFAVRAALGSGRSRLIRQLMIEGLLLAAIGGALGIFIAYGAVGWFRAINPIELPAGADVSIHLPVLVFTAIVSLATALIFSVAPASNASRQDMHGGLRMRGASPGSRALARTLITTEIGLSMMLLAGGGLLMRSVVNMSDAPLGFDPDHLITAFPALPRDRYQDAQSQLRLFEDLHRRLATLPGITAAAIASSLPPFGVGENVLQIDGRPVDRDAQRHDVSENSVDMDYFRALGIAQQRGRVFDDRDQPKSELVAVVNQALAREYFPHEDPLGRRVRIGDDAKSPWLTIVGVVANERRPELFHEMSWAELPIVYRALAQNPGRSIGIAVRTVSGTPGMARQVASAVTAIDPDIPIGDIQTMRDRLSLYLKYPRFRAMVVGSFAVLALLLAVAGLHGLLSQFVTQRTGEIGIRVAVGARPRDVLRFVAGQAGLPVAEGIVMGLVLALGLARFLSSLLYSVKPTDAWSLAGAAAILLAASIVAILVPARRALRVDPSIALRTE